MQPRVQRVQHRPHRRHGEVHLDVLGLHDPNRYSESLSLRREFQIREGVRLAFQADAFNPLNWVVFAGPNINITSSSFGKVTATSSSPRVLQFNARVMV